MTGLDDPQVFIPELFASHARYFPDRPAVVVGEVRRTWGEFDRNISRVANALLARGIGRGDRVAVLMGNRADTLEVIFGIVRAGACAVPPITAPLVGRADSERPAAGGASTGARGERGAGAAGAGPFKGPAGTWTPHC